MPSQSQPSPCQKYLVELGVCNAQAWARKYLPQVVAFRNLEKGDTFVSCAGDELAKGMSRVDSPVLIVEPKP